MDKNFIVDQEGRVFLPVTKDVGKYIFKKDKEKKIFMLYANGDAEIVNDKSDIKNCIGQMGVFVGTLQGILCERKDLFKTLDSIAQYYTLHGRLPWGIKGLIASRGWVSDKREGYRYVIRDEAFSKEFRVTSEGAIELQDV